MSDLYYQPLQPRYYLPSNGYPPNRSFHHGRFHRAPPHSRQTIIPPVLSKHALPPHVPHPPILSTHPSSMKQRLSRPSSLRVQRHISNLHGRPTTLKKPRRTSTTQAPAFPISGALSTIQLARGRPDDWRSGYKPPSKSFRRHFESFIGPRKRITPRFCILTPPLRLNFLLVATQAERPNIFYDLRKPQIEDAILLPYLNRPPTTIDFCQLITSPPIHHMTVWHRKLPWQINIEASQPNGITIYDFFQRIHRQLHRSVAQEEYYTDELAPADREGLTMAFRVRCAMYPDQLPAGLRRIDFLGQEVCFIGLKRGQGGRWEFKTQLPPPKKRMIID